MTITKTSSASYRVVLDSLRTGVVWLFGMAVGSEKFHLLQACLGRVGTTVRGGVHTLRHLPLSCVSVPTSYLLRTDRRLLDHDHRHDHLQRDGAYLP